jgi:HK97 family phage major capsid protein
MEDNFKYLKELLSTSTGTEGSLLIEKTIYPTLIDEYLKKLIPRTEAAIVITNVPGSSIDLDLVTNNKLKVRQIAEGSEITLDQAEYSSSNFKPLKYGVGIKITREMLEDGKWDLLNHNIMLAGRRMAENENSLVISALDGAANTVSGGATVTLGNIIRAMQYLTDVDSTPTTMVFGPEVHSDLLNLEGFQKVSYAGTDETLRGGTIGQLFGMKLVGPISANAGITTTSSYVFDKNFAYVIVEKRPITVENYDIKSHDLSAAVVTQRITVGALRTNAIAKITSS